MVASYTLSWFELQFRLGVGAFHPPFTLIDLLWLAVLGRRSYFSSRVFRTCQNNDSPARRNTNDVQFLNTWIGRTVRCVEGIDQLCFVARSQSIWNSQKLTNSRIPIGVRILQRNSKELDRCPFHHLISHFDVGRTRSSH